MRGTRERRIRGGAIADVEDVAYVVGAFVPHRLGHRQRFVLDLHQLGGILRLRQRLRDDDGNRVADVPSVPGDYPYGTSDCYGSLSASEPECVASGCTDRPNGRCAAESCLSSWCTCVYACASDADCGADEACLRPEHGLEAGLALPQCVPASCRTAADCGSGECGVAVVPASTTRQLRLTCRAPTDECRADGDCDGGSDICAGIPELGWTCQCSHCWCD